MSGTLAANTGNFSFDVVDAMTERWQDIPHTLKLIAAAKKESETEAEEIRRRG
jgi:hypothetical protein